MKNTPKTIKSFQDLFASYGTGARSVTGLPADWHGFNEAIGLPLHPNTRQPGPLLEYQNEIATCGHREVLVNKSNKIGVTETLLREAAWRGTAGDCVGYQMAIGAQDYMLAINNMRRLQRIFRNSDLLNPLVNWEGSNQKVLELAEPLKTYYFVLPRNAPAARGWDLLKWAFGDEAAHHGLLDDSDYPLALQTRLANTDGYMRYASTPHGQRGFFYQKCVVAQLPAGNPDHIDAKYFELPYTKAVGRLFSKEWIESMRSKMTEAEFNQEFSCRFISGANAAIEADLVDNAIGEYESR